MNILYISISGNTRSFVARMQALSEQNTQKTLISLLYNQKKFTTTVSMKP